MTQRNGKRHSAADAYLNSARKRANLSVMTGAHATQVLIEKRRAVGMAYVRDGVLEQARADGETILSGGTINSPQLLLLSGIGPADEIKKCRDTARLTICPVWAKTLQDHVMVSVGYLCTKAVTLASAESVPNLLRYFLFKRGPLVSNVAEAGIFLRTRSELAEPDLQLLFGPAYYVNHGLSPRKEHCFGFGPTLVTPESRGEISLRSTNPLEPPAIRANYLSTEADMQVIVHGVRLSRQLAHSKAFEAYRGDELHPGNKCADRR